MEGVTCTERRDSRYFNVVKAFFVSVLRVVKTKSGCTHFETFMSDMDFLNVDVGDMCHSQKQMPFLVEIMCCVIDDRMKEVFSAPLKAT